MGPLDLLNHLLNFVAPALFLAVLLHVAARFFLRRTPATHAWWMQVAVNFAAGLAVLAFGLWFFGRDGKMATYAMLVVCTATSQWLLSRGWRK